MKKSKWLGLALLMVLCLSACGKKETADTTESKTKPKENKTETKQEVSVQDTTTIKGETLATLHIKDYGDITVKFFKPEAPKAVENFITHAKDGYYDGTIFHRVIADFMIQGGDPGGDGLGGESIWGEAFEDEFAENLLPIRGALCMANAGANTNGSQFFIVQTKETYEEYFEDFELTEEQKTKFLENGGTPWLTNAHTVFGHVVSGMDVVDKIAATETGANDMPVEDIIIESISISEAE